MAVAGGGADTARVDIDFTFAIHNRTGKYFIGRDVIAIPGLPIGRVYYWRWPARDIPAGVAGKILGRSQLLEVRGRTLGGLPSWLPRRRSGRPVLHLDPFSVPTVMLRPSDAVVCHDLGPVTHPHLFDRDVGAIYDRIYRDIAAVGPHVVFVSRSSRDTFYSLYPDARATTSRIIYPAIRSDIDSGQEDPVDGVPSRFLLTVGAIGHRKNQMACLDAYTASGLNDDGVGYVICGGKEVGFDDVAARARVIPGVVHLPYVSNAQLRWLYRAALGFVLVSHLEGFGMPVAEAIARGLVPLVSRNSVLEEVAGDSALTAGPENINDITAGLRQLAALSDGERNRRLGRLQASITRFALPDIEAQWRRLFADVAAAAR